MRDYAVDFKVRRARFWLWLAALTAAVLSVSIAAIWIQGQPWRLEDRRHHAIFDTLLQVASAHWKYHNGASLDEGAVNDRPVLSPSSFTAELFLNGRLPRNPFTKEPIRIIGPRDERAPGDVIYIPARSTYYVGNYYWNVETGETSADRIVTVDDGCWLLVVGDGKQQYRGINDAPSLEELSELGFPDVASCLSSEILGYAAVQDDVESFAEALQRYLTETAMTDR